MYIMLQKWQNSHIYTHLKNTHHFGEAGGKNRLPVSSLFETRGVFDGTNTTFLSTPPLSDDFFLSAPVYKDLTQSELSPLLWVGH